MKPKGNLLHSLLRDALWRVDGRAVPCTPACLGSRGQSSAQRSSKGQRGPQGWRGPKGLQEVLEVLVTGAVGYPDQQHPADRSCIGGSLEGKLLRKNECKHPSQFKPDTGCQRGVLIQISLLGNYQSLQSCSFTVTLVLAPDKECV